MGRFFDWLHSWFSKGDRLDIYQPRERLIFTYFDGQKLVKADPMVLVHRVADKGAELDADRALARSPMKKARLGHIGLVTKIRSIFNVKTLEDGGLTDAEVIALLDQFWEFCDSLKKNIPSSQTSSTVLEDCKTTSAESPPIPSISDSGLTENESSTEEQNLSHSDQVFHSE